MSFYSLPPLIIGIVHLIIVYFVIKTNRSPANISFSLMCIGGSIWLFSYAALYNIADYDSNFITFLCRLSYLGVTLIPIMYYRFVIHSLRIRSKISVYVYIIGSLFITISIFTPLIVNGAYKYFWGYYPKRGLLHPLYLVYVLTLFLICLGHLYKGCKDTSDASGRLRVKYLFWAFLFGNLAAIDFIQNYGFEFYPIGCFLIGIFGIVIAYAIVKYRIMDIRVAITRAGVFIAVYTIVLGLPFILAARFKAWLIDYMGPSWWIAPLGLMAALATIGPFIYIYISRRAEEKISGDNRRSQNTLKQAAVGMTRIRNLKKLLNLITHIVTKTVKISYAAIYLYDHEKDGYILQISRDNGKISLSKLSSDNPLVTWLMVKREPMVYEEIKRQMEDNTNVTYKFLEENMRHLNAAVIIPSFLEDKIMGFIVLGEKISGEIYTQDDLNVFQVLASQAALAIENAQFYEEAKEMQDQIAQAEKMATIGTMADGLSHQINNRFYALSLIAGDSIDTIKMTDTSKCTPEVREMIDSINHALERIQVNVMQGGEVVKGILKYTRKGDEKFEDLTMDQIIDGTLEMVQFKVRLSEIDIVRDYPKDGPKIRGNLIQLQECFFNFIDNAYDAINERKAEMKEEGYRGRVVFSTIPKGEYMEITVEDNGLGVKEENIRKVFTPFFTTKISARKGTGLGLYVINKIITDAHKGRIAFESEHGIGTRFILELPIAK